MPTPLIAGEITQISTYRVRGWMRSPGREITPLLVVGGRGARLNQWPVETEAAASAPPLGGAAEFEFHVNGYKPGDAFELYAQVGRELHHVTTATASGHSAETNFMRQLRRAAEIAAQPEAVAVVCWESGHNPIGRAKVLYDVLRAAGRPAVIFAYSFAEFGNTLWPPMADSGVPVVTVPWARRQGFHDALRAQRLDFDTVWLCKPRYPTFELAAQVSHAATRLTLDLDDNEEVFSSSVGSFRKPYGLSSIGASRMLTEHVPARTVASASLQQEYGGWLVRHAREPYPGPARRRAGSPFKLGFIGTVRPHKNLLAAAEAVTLAKWKHDLDIELHVLGDIQPADLVGQLRAAGAHTGGVVRSDQLGIALEELDGVLTGYPSPDPDDVEITRYQISSKIGDALAHRIPALVPQGPSVADLASVPGVHLFDERTFGDRLREIVSASGRIQLPHEFTLAGAYEGFSAAEREAEGAPRAGTALRSIRSFEQAPAPLSVPRPGARRNILLVWKQLDGGLYGRRVDQVARAYRRAHPDARVVLLELTSPAAVTALRARADSHLSDASAVLSLLDRKLTGRHCDADGVEYRTLILEERSAGRALEDLLLSEKLLPQQTTVVLFPAVPSFDVVHHALSAYPTIVDVVDNQFSWTTPGSDGERRVARQYGIALRTADHVCFSSEANRRTFARSGLLDGGIPTSLISNWYSPPEGVSVEHVGSGSQPPHLIYTGNMNDRIDWGLMQKLLSLPSRPWLHLVGTAERARPRALRRLLEHGRVVFHGPQDERETLRLLQYADVAVMPHDADEHSRFMNPLKLSMYAAMGLETVSTMVPGIDPDAFPVLTVARRRPDFMEAVTKAVDHAAEHPPSGGPPRVFEPPAGAQEYVALLESAGRSRDS